MIRSTLSFCALFGALILGSKLLQESTQHSAGAPKSLDDASRSSGDLPAVHVERRADSQAKDSWPASDGICFVSYDEDLSQKVRDPDDNDVPPRPARELADLLKGEPAVELPAADKPIQSDQDAPPARSKGSAAKADDDAAASAADDSDQIELTPELELLRDRVRQCLAYY
ncbi:MAG: hypothetical protein L0211_19200, partial [Planctomycetaceae bacterium]|nr:hypothetical protein [Planctomycetaceae bacterium]